MVTYKTLVKVSSLIIILLLSCSFSVGQYDSIIHDGLNRTYLLHLPTEYSENDTFPLVIAMHGGFGSAYNIQSQSQLSEKADEAGFIVVYPEGMKGGALNVRTWNAGWCCGYASESHIDDVGFIDALLDTLMDQYLIDASRIYATGMSNGGFMSYRLACELSDRIAAISPVSASMSVSNCTPSREIPIIHFHSYIDESVPYEGGIGSGISDHYNSPVDSIMKGWATINGCSVLSDTIVNSDQYTFIKWTHCDCKTEIHCYITQDGGHSWPGGVQTPIGDPVSNYINATDLMWPFFQQHSLNCETTAVIESNNDGDSSIELFPNPTTGIIHIRKLESMPEFVVIVHNNLGQMIFVLENKEAINLTSYPKGIYYISIRTNDNIAIRKIMKIQ